MLKELGELFRKHLENLPVDRSRLIDRAQMLEPGSSSSISDIMIVLALIQVPGKLINKACNQLEDRLKAAVYRS
jgi:hypothetical protein